MHSVEDDEMPLAESADRERKVPQGINRTIKQTQPTFRSGFFIVGIYPQMLQYVNNIYKFDFTYNAGCHASKENPMKNKYTIAAFLNLATLVVGLVVGFMLGSGTSKVNAQAITPVTPKIEEVTPGMTVGTIGVGLLLAHQTETDNLVVNGFDVMKIQEGILNYLGTRPLAEKADLLNIIEKSRAPVFYKVREVSPPATPTPTPKGEKPKP